jgi:hypothetical protein
MVAYAVIRTARADTGDLPILRQMLRTEWQALQRLALMPHMSLSAEVTGSIIGLDNVGGITAYNITRRIIIWH